MTPEQSRGLLSYTEICELIEDGVIEGASYKHVNSASLDIHLGDTFMVELPNPHNRFLDLAAKQKPEMKELRFTDYGNMYHLHPGQFILAQSAEVFHLPNNISAEYKLNSSLARAGLDHLNAGWCDAGWNGSVLTLEYKNCLQYNVLTLSIGMRAGQMVFFRHTPVPEDKSYAVRGRYNGDLQVSGVKHEQPIRQRVKIADVSLRSPVFTDDGAEQYVVALCGDDFSAGTWLTNIMTLSAAKKFCTAAGLEPAGQYIYLVKVDI